MELLTIRIAGFTATVDACARDGGQLWCVSLLGNQQSVRALWARLVKGETGPRDHRRRAVREHEGPWRDITRSADAVRGGGSTAPIARLPPRDASLSAKRVN